MKNCSYTLYLNGEFRQMTYGDLVEFVANNINALSTSLSDVIFSEDTRQSETIAKLAGIKQDIELSYIGIDELTGEPRYQKRGNDIPVTQLIEEALDINGNPIVTPMSIREYKIYKAEQLVDEGYSTSAANKLVNEEVQRWGMIGNNSSKLHKIINDFFDGKSPEQIKQNAQGLSEHVVEKMISNLTTVRDQILTIHGSDARMAPRYMISSEIKGEDNRAVGAIDLIVVDGKGQAHIYLFKGSASDYSERQNVKEKKYDYQLAFYRQMLAANGISAKNMSLNIVPMRMYGIEEDVEVGDVEFESIQRRDRLSQKLDWETGAYFKNVNNIIPVQLGNKTSAGNTIETITAGLKKMFPTQTLDLKRKTIDVDTFIFGDPSRGINSRVYDSTEPHRGVYQFRDYVAGQTIFIKEDSPKATNSELRAKVKEYLATEAEQYAKRGESFMNSLGEVLEGKLTLADMYPNNPKLSNFVQLKFKKYLDGNWETVENAELARLGIFILHNKERNVIDFVAFSGHVLNTPMKLDYGTTLLGAFEKDEFVLPKYNLLLNATNGNIDLMKIMAAINEMPELLVNGAKIGNMSVLNLGRAEATESISRKAIISSFNIMTNRVGITNNITSDMFVNDIDLLKYSVSSLLNPGDYGNSRFSTLFNNIWALDSATSHDLVKELLAINDQLVSTFPELKNSAEWLSENADRAPVQVYIALWHTILSQNPDIEQITEPHNIERYGTSWKNKTIANGSMLSNPQFVNERSLKVVVSQAYAKMGAIRSNISTWTDNFYENYIKKIKEEKGYGKLRDLTMGDQFTIYSNLFVKDQNGNISNSMMFKNPYNPGESLTNTERELLKYILYEINRYRFGLQGDNDPNAERHKNNPKWFQVPLLKADKSVLVKGRSMLGNAYQTVANFFVKKNTQMDPDINEDTRNSIQGFYELTSHFDRSDSEGHREELLANTTAEDWETNVETLMINYMFNRMMIDGMNKILPWISGIKAVLNVYSKENNVNLENSLEFIDNFVEKSIKNETLLDDEAKRVAKYTTMAKYFASAFCLGFSPIAGVRQMMEGVWKGLSLSFSKYYGADQFGIEDITKAWSIMVGDGIQMNDTMKAIEAINNRWGIVNRDFNILADRLKSNKTGLYTPISKYLFWFTTAPDYFHRMSLVIAQMMHDGTWEACTFKDGQLKYDWKKDKRFNLLANPRADKNSKEYKKQLTDWRWLRDMLDKENGTKTKDFGELSSPYERAKIERLKNFSDMTYGFYDHETRMMFESTLMGSFMMQFRTYLTGVKNKYLLTPGVYGKERTQMVDDKTGKPLFLKEVIEEDGTSHQEVTTEDTGSPLYDYSGNWMEGIVWSLVDAFNDFKRDGYKVGSFINSIKQSPAKVKNMRELGKDLLMMFLLGVLGKMLVEMLLENREQELKGKKPTLESTLTFGMQKLFTKAYLGSYGDFGLLMGLYDFGSNVEPASIGIIGNFLGSSGKLITGNKSFDSWANTNFGLYRSVKGFVDAGTEVVDSAIN